MSSPVGENDNTLHTGDHSPDSTETESGLIFIPPVRHAGAFVPVSVESSETPC